MPDAGISSELRAFIAESINSVEALEVLLLVQSAPGQEWSVQAVYDSVKSSHASVGQRLQELVQSGLLVAVPGGRYQFRPQTQELGELVKELASAYKDQRVRIIEAIYAPSTESLREFARAFRIQPNE